MFNWGIKKKIFQYQTRNLSLTLQKGWIEYKVGDEKIGDPKTFVKEKNGVGALQISLATAKHGEKFDIHEFLEKNNHSHIANINESKFREWTIYEYDDNQDERYIKFFHLVKFNVIVFVTYNCDCTNINKKELNEAVKIVRSIEVISNN